jgi:hypothetical protein
VFHEFVTILATMVDIFGDQATFTDLKPLRDKDIEADFYENIKHIQVSIYFEERIQVQCNLNIFKIDR